MGSTDVRDYFDEEAETYQKDHKSEMADKVEYVSRTSNGEERLLDVGCGSGYFMDAVKARTPVSTVGIDISRAMLPDSDKVVHGSATDLPFEAKCFDYVHIDTVLHHLVGDSRTESFENARRCLAELFRCLEDDGTLLLTEHVLESPIEPSIAPATTYYLLSAGSKFLSPLHPEIKSGLVANLFTRKQVRDLVSNAGGEILEVLECEIRLSRRERVLISHRSQYTLFVRKRC